MLNLLTWKRLLGLELEIRNDQMAVELICTATCRNNQLFIFDGLDAGESQTARQLHEDIADFANSIGRYNYCTHIVIESKEMLAAYFELMEVDCRAGTLFPALHFECHGDEQRGLWIAANKEYVSWPELAALIAKLNAATKNNIAVVLATCHGFALRRSVQIKNPCPFHFMIAPNQVINAGAIKDCILPFYKEVISSNGLNAAIKYLDSRFKRFIAGEWFYSIVGIFFTENLTGQSKKYIIETMVSNAVRMAGHSSAELIKSHRALAKHHTSNPEIIYNFLERNFFHGQSYIPYEDMKNFVDYQKSLR